jgi:hypothetical protein
LAETIAANVGAPKDGEEKGGSPRIDTGLNGLPGVAPKPERIENGKYNGLPYRGPKLNLKENDPDEMKPQLKYTAHIRTFDLSDETDLRDYHVLIQQIFDGTVVQSFEERRFVKKKCNWVIIVRWADMFYGAPETYEEQSDVGKQQKGKKRRPRKKSRGEPQAVDVPETSS